MNNYRPGTKFTCYFCNKTIENDTEMGHTSTCANVLVPCPNKCGSYVPRKDMGKHQRDCINRIAKSMPKLHINDDNVIHTGFSLDRNTQKMIKHEKDLQVQQELSKLTMKLSDFENRFIQNVNSNVTIQNIEALKNRCMAQSLEVEKLKYQSKLTSDWKKAVEAQIESFKLTLNEFTRRNKESDMHWMHLQEKLMTLEKLHMDFNHLADAFYKEQGTNRSANFELAQSIDALKDAFTQDNASTAALWNDQKQAIESLQNEIDYLRKALDEQRAKYSNVVFDLRAVTQIASEAAEKIEIQERQFNSFRRDIHQIKIDLDVLEGLATADEMHKVGSIIWKISEVNSKLKMAKEENLVFKSPIFHTYDYGYRIRVLLYLNGLNKWKDRYALLCIHVLKGEYDMILKWPCHIEGNILLRDLENMEAPKNFSKYISAKRQFGDEEGEEPQESSSSFIFIPHSTLFKERYCRNDTLFLEIKFDNGRKRETSL